MRAASLPPPAGAAAAAAAPGHRNVAARCPSSVRPSVRPSAPLGATSPASARVSEAASPLSRFSHTGLGEGEAGRARNFKAGGGLSLTITLWKMSPPWRCPHALASPFPSLRAGRPLRTRVGGGTSSTERRARRGWPTQGRGRLSRGKRQNHCGAQAAGGPSPPLLPSRRRLLLLPPSPPGASSLLTAKAVA